MAFERLLKGFKKALKEHPSTMGRPKGAQKFVPRPRETPGGPEVHSAAQGDPGKPISPFRSPGRAAQKNHNGAHKSVPQPGESGP